MAYQLVPQRVSQRRNPLYKCQQLGLICCITLLGLFASSGIYANDIAILLSQASPQFDLISNGITDEIEDEDEITFLKVSTKEARNSRSFGKLLDETKPKVIVLMGNKAITSYHAFQEAEKNREFPISIAVAAVFVDQQIKALKNAIGIQYEIPIAASVSGLRSIASDSIQRVGVVYSPRMKAIIEYNKAICALENIELVTIELPNNKSPSPSHLKKYLKRLTSSNIDALWVTNDTNLLSKELIIKAWKPVLGRFKKHVIVGVKNLIKTQLKFGNLAVFPDHYELGVQTSDIIIGLKDEDWTAEIMEAEPPISVKKHFNLMLTEQYRLSVNKSRLNEFDKVIY